MTDFWIPCYERLPAQSDIDLCRSGNVLATDGETVYVCYLQFDEVEDMDDDPRLGHSVWKIAGRDFYDYEPTYWRPLPDLPKRK